MAHEEIRTDLVPAPVKGGTRTGFTTGACSAAAAKAAVRLLVRGGPVRKIESTLPSGRKVVFPLLRSETDGKTAVCSVVKDAGDDPDCTHGAELVATVNLSEAEGIAIRGGAGVATVTRPGLGLEVGTHAINPVPRKNIAAMVAEELAGTRWKGADIVISVPAGEGMAKETTNARLGLLGGISILGTTGIVRPYSTAAFRASMVQSIDVAAAQGIGTLVLTTGGKSESFAMRLHPDLSEAAFIQVGDFIGAGIRHCAKRGIRTAIVVGMMGKMAKMADGRMQTHAAGSQVNLGMLAEIAAGLGAPEPLREAIREGATARRALELCDEAGIVGLQDELCRRIVGHLTAHAGGPLEVRAELVDFEGNLLGRHPKGEA